MKMTEVKKEEEYLPLIVVPLEAVELYSDGCWLLL